MELVGRINRKQAPLRSNKCSIVVVFVVVIVQCEVAGGVGSLLSCNRMADETELSHLLLSVKNSTK
jgi:NADH:ubiquinone oxidoreductase subunit K